MSRLRVIQKDTPESTAVEMTMAEALNALVAKCLAANPVVIFIAWEHDQGKVTSHSVPDSYLVKSGFINQLHGFLHEDEEE